MSKLNADLNSDLSRHKYKIYQGQELEVEDLKVILLRELCEEDLNESKQ
jgi:hypothetical protein